MGLGEWRLRGDQTGIGDLSLQGPLSPGNDQTAEVRKNRVVPRFSWCRKRLGLWRELAG
jgi:hypothetical protein